MTAVQCDLPPIRKGDEYAVVVRFWSDAAKTVPLNVASEDFEAGLAPSSSAAVTTPLAIDTTQAGTGVIALSLTKDDTDDLASRVWRWRLRSGSADSTWLAGSAPVVRSYDLGDQDGTGALDVTVSEGEVIDVSFAVGFVLLTAAIDIDGGSFSSAGAGALDGGSL